MPRRIVVFALLAVALAALFVRLGVWQLNRLEQRRAYNADVAERLRQPPVALSQLGSGDRTRRAFVEGTPDWDHEFVQAGRSMNGSPGVYIFTPVRIDSAHAVLVNRGWVYSPDAATVELPRWREPRARFSGYTAELPTTSSPRSAVKGRATHVLDVDAVRALVPYPTSPLYLVARDSAGADAPARLPEIELTNGPHLSYAIQWFSFALIALVGGGVVLARARQSTRAGSTAA